MMEGIGGGLLPMRYQRLVDLVLYKVYAELKSEATRTYAGLLWWVLEPIIYMAIFYFIFGVLFQRGTPDFIAFLLVGLTAWHWFQATITQGGHAITANRPLIQQVVVPKPLFPTVIVITNTIKFLIVYLILLIFLVFYGIEPTWSWLYSALVLLAMLVLITGGTFLLASLMPLVPDVRVLVENAFRALFFLSGIFYDVNTMPERFADWLRLNPVVGLLESLRGALLGGELPDPAPLLEVCAIGLVCGAAGVLLMRANRSRYAKSVI